MSSKCFKDGDLQVGYLRIENPDEPIYRIFSLWHFEQLCRLRQLTLVHPKKWQDPFETQLERVMMRSLETREQQPLEPFLQPIYAQCWSKISESDLLWRAYSNVVIDAHFNRNIHPSTEGVKVKSTPRKLLNLLRNADTTKYMHSFAGAVLYLPENEILQGIVNNIDKKGPSSVGQGMERASISLIKRKEFEHEDEVRLICVDNGKKPQQKEFLQIPIHNLDIFDEITFDPRLVEFERKEREATIKELGYEGGFSRSSLNGTIVLDAKIPTFWWKK